MLTYLRDIVPCIGKVLDRAEHEPLLPLGHSVGHAKVVGGRGKSVNLHLGQFLCCKVGQELVLPSVESKKHAQSM